LLKQSEKVCAENLAAAGVRLLQFRDKRASAGELLRKSRGLAELLSPEGVTFFVNDRADVANLAGASGVHVGQEDLAVEQARVVMGEAKFVGVSTHNRGGSRIVAASPPLDREAYRGYRRNNAGARRRSHGGGRRFRFRD
jgi:thiamine-phosphate diphosphorylase